MLTFRAVNAILQTHWNKKSRISSRMYFVDSGYQRTHGCLPPVVVSCAHTHTIATIRIINTIETNSITTRLALNECWDFFFLLSINSFAWISPGTREPRDRYRFTQNVAICRLHDDTMTEYYSNFVARFSFLEFFFVFKKIGRFFLLACESEIKMSDERQAMINHVKWRKKKCSVDGQCCFEYQRFFCCFDSKFEFIIS